MMSEKLLYEVKDMSGGLNVGTRPHLIRDNEVQDCQNIDLLPGQAATCDGYGLLNSLSAERIYNYAKRDGTVQLVQQVADKLYIDGTLVKSGIVGLLSFETYQNLLFCTNIETSFIWNGLISVWGIEKPGTTCTATVSGDAGLPNEGRSYYVTFVNDRGQESNPSPASNTVSPSLKKVDLTDIPTGESNTAKRRIYAYATIGSTTGTWLLVEIADNTTTTYTDNMSGSSLIIGNALETDNDPPTKSSYILEHKNRLFLAQGSFLYFSKLNKPESFPLSNYIPCNDGGDRITGIKVLNDWVVILKERSIQMLSVEGEPSSWNFKTINDSRGCPYPETIQLLDNNIIFMGVDDLYQIQPTLVQDERSIVPVGTRIESLLVNESSPISVDYDGRYWLKISKSIIIYDYRRNYFTKYVFPDVPKSFCVTTANKLLFGTIKGTMQYGMSKNFNGVAISSFVVGKDFDMGSRSRMKKIRKIFVYYRKETVSDSMYVQFGTDKVGYGEKLTIGLANGYMEWGDNSLWGRLWGGQSSPGQESQAIFQKDNYFRVKMGSDSIPSQFYGFGIIYKLKRIR